MADLHIRGVSKSFARQSILHNNHLDLSDDKILALLGPSGCGKTTLLRMIAGFDHVDAGEIVLGHTVVSSASVHMPPEKRRIGYVPQEGALFPHLTIADNILYGLPRRERRIERVADLLAITGLADLVSRLSASIVGRRAAARGVGARPCAQARSRAA